MDEKKNNTKPTLEEPSTGTKVAPELMNTDPRDGYNAIPSYASNKEWEADRRALAKARHDALKGFLGSSVMQRTDLLRDTLAVSITILFGALTIYFISGPSHSIIKTQSIFFFSIAVLVLGVIANLIARAEIIKHLQLVSYNIEKNYLDLFEASRNVMKNPAQFNIDTAYRVEGSSPALPNLRWRGENGHTIAIWTIVFCILGITLSFLLNIHY